MKNIMTLLTEKNGVITLTPAEQEQVHEFYVLHSTMEEVSDRADEEGFKLLSETALETVAKRVIELIGDYHISEEDAIKEVFADKNYMNSYATRA